MGVQKQETSIYFQNLDMTVKRANIHTLGHNTCKQTIPL